MVFVVDEAREAVPGCESVFFFVAMLANSLVTIVPKCSAFGLNTHTPPGAVAKMLPALSTFRPSGMPLRVPTNLVTS